MNAMASKSIREIKNVELPSVVASTSDDVEDQWTCISVSLSLLVFVLAGLFEIGGGWFVWQAIKEAQPKWYIPVGCMMLAVYGFIPTLQPPSPSTAFGRVFAAYGGIFIALSFAWGVIVDKMPLDKGDCIGGGVALVGVLIAWFWPR